MTPTDGLCACLECDLLHRQAPIADGSVALCRRCGAPLYHAPEKRLEGPVALTLAAAILLAIAQGNALLELQLAGFSSSATFVGAVEALQEHGMAPLAVVVGTTAVVLPWLELGLLAAMLLPLWRGRVPRYLGLATRLMQRVHPWNMLEVFLLGVLVALVRLGDLADVIVGPALWALGALIVTLTVLASMLDRQAFWDWAAVVRDGDA